MSEGSVIGISTVKDAIQSEIAKLHWIWCRDMRLRGLKVVDCKGQRVALVRSVAEDAGGLHVKILGHVLVGEEMKKAVFEADDSLAEFYAFLPGARLVKLDE